MQPSVGPRATKFRLLNGWTVAHSGLDSNGLFFNNFSSELDQWLTISAICFRTF